MENSKEIKYLDKLNMEQKIMLWEHYDNHINGIGSGLVNASTMVTGIFTVLTALWGNGSKAIYTFPAIAVIFLFYISYQQRVVEILRGYLMYIEEDIISCSGYNGISWSKFGVMKNYNVNYFRAQLLCGPMFIVMIVALFSISVYSMLKNGENLYVMIVYTVICSFFCISFGLDMIDNYSIAEMVKSKLKAGELNEKPKINRRQINDIIRFWKRR